MLIPYNATKYCKSLYFSISIAVYTLILFLPSPAHAIVLCDRGVNFANGSTYATVSGLVACHEDGTDIIRKTVHLKNGKREGLSIYYDQKGRKSSEIFYKNDKEHGEARYYNVETGKLKKILNYAAGKRQGAEENFSSDGKLKKTKQVENGTVETYQKAIGTKTLTTLKNGKRNGPYIVKTTNGKILSEANYKNGKLHGTLKEYYSNGNLKNVLNFKNGKQSGQQKEYYQDGKTLKKENVITTSGHITETERNYQNGQKKYTMKRIGKDSYEETHYHDNGQKKYHGVYKDRLCNWGDCGGKPVGKHNIYREDGSLEFVKHYDQKKSFVETTVFYTKDGKIEKTENYYPDGSRK